jgi:SAM-dependent methyltransferase
MVSPLQDPTIYQDQFDFQRRYARGRMVNVGCNTDGAGFKQLGGVNVDLFQKDEHTGLAIPADVLADARHLPFKGNSFDSVVLGEILEHMQSHDAIHSLKEARTVLRPGGRIVATIPHDDRGGPAHAPEYYPGIAAYHYREISRQEFFGWIEEAGLKLRLWAQIFYCWGKQGTGIVATL